MQFEFGGRYCHHLREDSENTDRTEIVPVQAMKAYWWSRGIVPVMHSLGIT
jgi:hypothetical protein